MILADFFPFKGGGTGTFLFAIVGGGGGAFTFDYSVVSFLRLPSSSSGIYPFITYLFVTGSYTITSVFSYSGWVFVFFSTTLKALVVVLLMLSITLLILK